MTNPPETLETRRLKLRKPVLRDADEIFRKYAQDPEVTKYLTWRPNRNVQETRSFVRACLRAWTKGKSFHWVIVRQEDSQLLGMITARVDDQKWELGYVLARSYWGKGYMTEVLKRLVDWALKQKEIYRVWSVCDVDNLASARVMEKAGMKREGILRRWSMHPTISAEPRDSYCYSITK
ncbi:MAG TPA: GNAT family N-acetyltransferase [Candidatus Binatia bacterium]|nr:GNAT family N-acetyltransferase [Candidatus Binatia bacterium]